MHFVYLYIRFNTQLSLAPYATHHQPPASTPSTHTKTHTYATANPPLGTGRLYWFISRFVRSPLIAWQPPPVTCHRHSRRRSAAIVFVVVYFGPFIFWPHAIFRSTAHALVRLTYATPGGGDRNRPSSYPVKVRKMKGRVPVTFGVRAFYVMACTAVAVLGVQGTDDSLRSALEAISDRLGSTPPRVASAVYLNTGWYPALHHSTVAINVRVRQITSFDQIVWDLMQFYRYII